MGFKDHYLQYSEASDQLCGHTVAGLNVNSHEFALSPPFFLVHDGDDDDGDNDKGDKGEGDDDINDKKSCNSVDTVTDRDINEAIVTAFGAVAIEHRLLCHFLLASLLRHRKWLQQKIARSSCISGSTIFWGQIFDKVESAVKVCHPWTNNQTLWHITFTGIPPLSTLMLM